MSGSAALTFTAETTSDVDDLRAMLANTEKLVETLRSELDLSERALKESEKELSKEQDETTKLEAQISSLHDECGKLEDQIADLKANPIGDDEIEDLARVRKLLKAGSVDAARDGLERLLDGIDGSWRTRAATVVSQGQGALL